MNQDLPFVSVVTITCNQAGYIRECIESILPQKTNFRFEYIIADDCSTDGTQDIVADYARRCPETIQLITSDHNVGAVMNAKRAFDACKGKYTAICEGDDYWTDPVKLQMQADFLEANREFSMCIHRVEGRDESGSKVLYLSNEDQKEESDIYDLFAGNFICLASCMFRNYPDLEYPLWFDGLDFTDWPFYVLHAIRGKIGFINRFMAVYRVHPNGIWTSKSEWDRAKSGIRVFAAVDEHLHFKYHDQLGRNIAELYQVLADHERKEGNKVQCRLYQREARRILKELSLVEWTKCILKFQLSKITTIHYDYRV